MRTYTPHTWIITKIAESDGSHHYRVFAGWYGGFAYGDSWKLNSGITGIREDDECYYFDGSSGSVYVCSKHVYGMSVYQLSVLNSLKNDYDIQELTYDEFKDLLKDGLISS